ncbi:unnamed protein product [Blumeria hordei]|uniref:CTLH domain-containing protein n=1 Tax=Blumeria hordei TaxID=2867405 RepID=A0A383UUQ0_BLUHO|nr:unnamed protein product [Blumeria hordei]
MASSNASTSSTVSTATPTQVSFAKRADEVNSCKSDLNDIILDYLTIEGYPCAAEKFSKEANIKPRQVEEEIRSRHEIQNLIHRGMIQEAIEAVNNTDPEVLDRNPSLHFDLLRLQLIELIRAHNSNPISDITPALQFAADQLAPRAPTNSRFMEDMEKTMALLVFPPDKLDSSLANLLDPSLRKVVAENVNVAMLVSQKSRREASIRSLVRLRAWAEEKARSQKIELPPSMKLELDDKKQETTFLEPMAI